MKLGSLASRRIAAPYIVAALLTVSSVAADLSKPSPQASDRLAEAAAQSQQPAERAEKIDALLTQLEALAHDRAVAIDQTLHLAWAAYILAENDAERARILAAAARVPDARARMLIGSFREFPELSKAYATANRTHSALIAKPEEANAKKRPPREIYGLNAFDAPYTADGWSDPFGFVGRWQHGEVTVDIIAYPFGNFLALLRTTARATPQRLLGMVQDKSLLLVGSGVRGTLSEGSLALNVTGSPHQLKRVPVGVTSFEKRPANARVLLDATSGLKNFRHTKNEAAWKLLPDGSMEIEPTKGSLFTKDSFSDLHGYLEFRQAYNSEGLGPRRGNSGLYIHNTYEVQITDSYGLPPEETSSGSIYHIAVPKVTASAPPLEWQSLEFKFRAPRFDTQGNKTANARLTLWMNGILLHDDVEIPNPTAGSVAGGKALKDPTGPQPLMLQSHGNLLQFRNLWVLPLDN
ncbi:3-keto-disaccharide hydrolase [Oleiharenicola lentus]|uniref:3-keto-disaccharide hydrolase n=1 Tax=Oleiharenicola lentus TaxID=2508720 RepID=UPI003F660EC5